ncbi:MAG: hypothetical protein Q4A52_04360 [Bacillota bacterium]|nr:hypothetical protein [Bacillota bacterium]
MTKIEILQKILEETYILISALDAEDLDIVETSLTNRDELIGRYEEAAEPSGHDISVLRQLQEEYRDAHDESMQRLETFRQLLVEAQNRNRTARNEADKTKRIHDQYANQLDLPGMTLDLKK